jgi:hypothetical protein
MIKYLLISGVLSLNVTYPNVDVCQEALAQVIKHDVKAICIPAGEDQSSVKMESMMASFIDMVHSLQAMEGKE